MSDETRDGAATPAYPPYSPPLAKTVGARIIRSLIGAAVKLLKPFHHDHEPTAFTSIRVPRSKYDGQDASRRTIRCDVYLPSYLQSSIAEEGNTGASGAVTTQGSTRLPVVVNMHGSGFLLFALGDDAKFCQQLADQVDVIVVDVDYSKAPEYPYPHAGDDVDDVLAWIKRTSLAGQGPDNTVASEETLASIVSRQSHGKQSVQGDCVALTGFSAGGNLVLTACVRAHKEGRGNDIRAVASFYPSTNLAEPPHLKPAVRPEKGASGGVLPAPIRRFFYSCYIPIDSSAFPPRESELVSPLYASPDVFPQSTTIITCSGDSLGREGRQLAERIMFHRRQASGQDKNDAAAKASSKELADPPAGMPDVPRSPVQHGIEAHGLLWWQAEGQGHAWDKLAAKGSHSDGLVRDAYSLVAKRLKEALRGTQ